jgi:uncharacterized protein YqiB (DUF1249 family)
MTMHHRNYLKLLRLLPDLEELQAGAFLRLEAAGFMPLTVDVLHRRGSRLLLALAHHFEAQGDLVPDPDMELRVDLEARTVEALSYQDAQRFDQLCARPGRVRPDLRRSLDDFLSLWLSNLHAQGHRVIERR